MLRGVLNPPGDKRWLVSLLETDVIWYELVRNSLRSDLNSRRFVKARIAMAKEKHNGYFDRRFVYFICSRDQVRFSTEQPARFSLFRRSLVVHLVTGDGRVVRKKIPAALLKKPNRFGFGVLPRLENTSLALTYFFPDGERGSIPVHDVLMGFELNLGIDTHVHYVGVTKNPDSRPMLDSHRGRQRTLAKVNGSGRDVLFFYNTFTVRYEAEDEEKGMRYFVSNAMTDDVDIRTEGLLIEKLLVWYFRPDCQGSIRNELGELRNLYAKLSEAQRVRRIVVDIEVDSTSDYFRFSSRVVDPSKGLGFAVEKGPEGLKLYRRPAISYPARHAAASATPPT
jgi:hypothetical protein